jgi:esterase
MTDALTLHHAFVAGVSSGVDSAAPHSTRRRSLYFLHGILGSGGNLRSLAKAALAELPTVDAVLVDLRMHGRSQGFTGPHTLMNAAADVLRLASIIGRPVDALVGHSYGGKVALFIAKQKLASKVTLPVMLLDSSPSARPKRTGSEGTMKVIDTLRRLPAQVEKRDQYTEFLLAEKLDAATVAWLAMNVYPVEGGYAFRLDVDAVSEMLDDYFLQDAWETVEALQVRPSVGLVIGERSNVVSPEDCERAERLGVSQTTVSAGHWVHAEAQNATALAIRDWLRAH